MRSKRKPKRINQSNKGAISQSLRELRERFERWREKRQKQGQVPEELWKAAVRVAQENAVSRVSRELGLDYRKLKMRVEKGVAAQGINRNLSSEFIELDISGLSIVGLECVVELEEVNGAKMKMHLKNVTGISPVELVKAFLQRLQ
jgi:hypothetical protein